MRSMISKYDWRMLCLFCYMHRENRHLRFGLNLVMAKLQPQTVHLNCRPFSTRGIITPIILLIKWHLKIPLMSYPLCI